MSSNIEKEWWDGEPPALLSSSLWIAASKITEESPTRQQYGNARKVLKGLAHRPLFLIYSKINYTFS